MSYKNVVARFLKGDKEGFRKWFEKQDKETQEKWLSSQDEYKITGGSNKPKKDKPSAKKVASLYLEKNS
jgi:hypothetical protein